MAQIHSVGQSFIPKVFIKVLLSTREKTLDISLHQGQIWTWSFLSCSLHLYYCFLQLLNMWRKKAKTRLTVCLKNNTKDDDHFVDSKLNTPFSPGSIHAFTTYAIPLCRQCSAPSFILDFYATWNLIPQKLISLQCGGEENRHSPSIHLASIYWTPIM